MRHLFFTHSQAAEPRAKNKKQFVDDTFAEKVRMKSQTPNSFSWKSVLRIAGLTAMIAPILMLCPLSQAQAAPAPTITKISPTVASPKGGAVITITGTNFVTGATVTFGTNSGTSVTFVSKTSLKATAPASTGGAEVPVNVTVTNPDTQSATLTNGLTYKLAAPTVTSIAPTVATPKGGTVITITGANFVVGATVTFGANAGTNVVFTSKSSLKATAPASTNKAEGQVNVIVTNPDGQAATLTNGLTYQLPAPTVTKISPTTASPNGGAVVTITGTNFVTGATVKFGANSATAVTFTSSTSLKATAPASTNKAEGPVNVTVTNPDSQAATLANALTYQYPAPTITSISPAVSVTTGGAVITITGNNFLSGATVSFGANNATKVVFVSKTSLQATTPASSGNAEGNVNVTVTNPDSQTVTLTGGLLYHLPPSLTSITPAFGLPAGGYTVALNGLYFRAGAAVLFGTVPATSVVFNSNTTLTVGVPAQAAGLVNVTVTDTDGLTTTLNNGFNYTAINVTQVSPITGPLSGGNTVTITGIGFTSGSTVSFGSTAATSVTFVSSTTLTAAAPVHVSGMVSITVVSSNGTGILPQAYDFSGGPIISSVAPAAGPLAGGSTVTVKGFNLKSVTQVLFGGTAASDFEHRFECGCRDQPRISGRRGSGSGQSY